MKTLKTLLSIFAIAAVLSTGTFAQSDNIAANAEVVAALTVIGTADIEFGTVTRNTPSSILPTAAEAGKFEIGGASSDFDVDFTLPSNLVGDATSANMPISFGASSASWDLTDTQGSSTTFDPSTGLASEDASTSDGEVFVWLGGEVSPTSTQPADTYTATVTLTVTNN